MSPELHGMRTFDYLSDGGISDQPQAPFDFKDLNLDPLLASISLDSNASRVLANPVYDYAPPDLPRGGQISEQQSDRIPGARTRRSSSRHMDIEVVKRSGKKLSLQENLSEALQALHEDGCLVLKGATSVAPASSEGVGSLDYVKREIVLNEAVRKILFSARNDDFLITACLPYRAGLHCERTGRDQEWEKMASVKDLVGAWCFHFGGDRNVSWIIMVDGCPRGADSGKMTEVRANGGDIFICHHWLLRSNPYLEKQPTPEVHAIVVSYLWKGFSGRGKIDRKVGDRIQELAGNDCSRSGDYIIWKRVTASK